MSQAIRSFWRPRALNQELSNNRARGGALHEEISVHFNFSLFSRRKLPKSGHPPPHHRGGGGAPGCPTTGGQEQLSSKICKPTPLRGGGGGGTWNIYVPGAAPPPWVGWSGCPSCCSAAALPLWLGSLVPRRPPCGVEVGGPIWAISFEKTKKNQIEHKSPHAGLLLEPCCSRALR